MAIMIKTTSAAFGLLALLLFTNTPVVYAAAGECDELDSLPKIIEMAAGTHREIQVPVKVKRLAVGDPEVADVSLTSPEAILVTGIQGGATNLSIWTACDPQPQQRMLFVTGMATSALNSSPQNSLGVATFPNQVQTDIRFVEVNRTKLKEIGTSLAAISRSRTFGFGSPGVALEHGAGGSEATVFFPETGFNIFWGGGSKEVLGALNMLENSGFAYTLARPSLVATSGQSASFLAGGEFPVPVPSTASDSVSIEYKEYGVRLSLTPTVIGPNRIALKVAPEVSELDFSNGITIEGTTVPSLNVRRTDTSISLASGDSFVISGLMSSRSISAVDKLPGLGDLPILGAFFRSSRLQQEERELLMIVTPHLVQPLAAGSDFPELPGAQLKNYDPSVYELFFFEKGEFDRTPGLSR